MTQTGLKEDMLYLDRAVRKIPVFTVSPAGSGPFPAVIVVHEIFGLNDHIKDVARRFANESICAYAPDLFAGAKGLPEDRNDLDAMRAVWQQIPDVELIADLQAVFELACHNREVQETAIGTIGYCMGGAIALMFAASTPRIRWLADYYGRIKYPELSDTKTKHPLDYVDQIQCPVLGLFAGHDELIRAEHITQLTERLKQLPQHSQVKTYPEAKHAFFNDRRQMYNQEASQDAWKTTLEFIARANGRRGPQ